MRRLGWARRPTGDRGVVAIVVAVSMTALLVAAAMVLDLGVARTEKLSNKGYADSAAAAGIRATDIGDGLSRPYPGVCAALSYLKANNPEMSGLAPYGPCSDPLLLNRVCVPGSNAAWYTSTVSPQTGRQLTVNIDSGYTTPDAAFPEDSGSYSGDQVSSLGGCDQLAVIVTEAEAPGFGSIASTSDLVTRVRTVARMTASSGGDASAALLILERTDCTAISVNSNNTFIQVKGFGDKPGVVHSDSNASGPNCVATTVPAILGKFAGPPGISARQSETGNPRLPGLITTVAGTGLGGAVPANATDGASKVCAELATPVTSTAAPATSCGPAGGRSLVGRGPVDRRYLVGVRAAMATAATEYNKSPTGPTPGSLTGYTVLGGTGQQACQNVANTNYTQAGAIFVNCPGGVNYNNFTFTNATTVVFNGDVKVGSGNTLSMPNVTRLYIKGSTTTNGGFQSSGTFNFNTGSSADCSTRAAAASAQIVVGTGSFTGGAQAAFHLCQTTVLMANSLQSGCSVPVPPTIGFGSAPYDNACNGYVDVNAGGAMDWSAPNRKPTTPAVQADWDNLEDLALWTEASHVSSIGGGASMTLTGVFFLPNANPFTISGHGNQTIAANAQFVARKLSVQGQGTLYMRPDPNDSFTLPLVSTVFNLVR
jgi:hypothetical protein